MPWWRDDEMPYRRFPTSRPRQAKGGIKARSKRGEFGSNWWAKRWIAALEGYDIGARLNRGRSYARGGQVLNIKIDKGQVRARVQGSRPQPYEIAIQVKSLAQADWQRLARALAGQAIFAAKLLAGEMPRDVEDVFRAEGLSLFPERLGDLATKCSCPDWSNPCKHIAAVYYLLGEEFDRDPFLIFTLRGLTRDELIDLMEAASPGAGEALADGPAMLDLEQRAALAPEPLASDPGRFWRGEELSDDLLGQVQPPPVAAALPRRLGGFPFWRGAEPFLNAVEPIYTRASARGLDVFLGQQAPAPEAVKAKGPKKSKD